YQTAQRADICQAEDACPDRIGRAARRFRESHRLRQMGAKPPFAMVLSGHQTALRPTEKRHFLPWYRKSTGGLPEGLANRPRCESSSPGIFFANRRPLLRRGLSSAAAAAK